MSITVILIIVVLVLLIAGLPHWYTGAPYGPGGWGYYPSGTLAVVLVVLLVLLLTGVLR